MHNDLKFKNNPYSSVLQTAMGDPGTGSWPWDNGPGADRTQIIVMTMLWSTTSKYIQCFCPDSGAIPILAGDLK